MSHDDIQGLNGFEGNVWHAACKRFMEGLQTDARNPFYGHLEAPVLPLPWDGHFQLHLSNRLVSTTQQHSQQSTSPRVLSLCDQRSKEESAAARRHLIPPDWQGHGCVEVLPPVIHWLSVPKDLGFKVLDHVLYDFSAKRSHSMLQHFQSHRSGHTSSSGTK